jgi:hypothetical protein
MTVTNDLSRFAKKVTSSFDRMQSKRTYTFIAKVAIKLIQDHVRKGYGIERQGGSLRRLKGLSKNYKKWRAGKGRKRLGRYAKPSFSNLNMTGKMINSMGILSISKKRVTIGPSKKRRRGSKKTNWQIAQYHHTGEGALPIRKFNYLSRREMDRVVGAFEQALTSELKNSRLSRRR